VNSSRLVHGVRLKCFLKHVDSSNVGNGCISSWRSCSAINLERTLIRSLSI
jgi:hypothetical protein